MKFRCERDTLADAVATVQRVAATRSGAMPVLAGLRLTLTGDLLELVGTDLETSTRVEIPADGQGDGVAVVTARLFSELLQKFEAGVVTVDFTGEEATVESGRFTTTLRTLTASEYPRLPETGDQGAVKIDAEAFGEAIRQVRSAVSKDDARPILTGVLVTAVPGGLRFVATDSYRLALRDLAGVNLLPENQKVLVAGKGLTEVERLLAGTTGEVEVVLGERDVVFRTATAEVMARLIVGEFPNYEQLIPSDYPNRLTVARDPLQAAVNRVRLVGQNRDSAPIKLTMGPAGLQLSANAQDIGEAHEELDAKYEGAELTIAFNSQFLLDGLDAAGSDEVVLESINELKPAVLRAPGTPDFLYLLMPVRIS